MFRQVPSGIWRRNLSSDNKIGEQRESGHLANLDNDTFHVGWETSADTRRNVEPVQPLTKTPTTFWT